MRTAVDRDTGLKYACKTIPKVLDPKKFSDIKRNSHLQSIRREVTVLQRLKGCLNVVELHDVLEDEVSETSSSGQYGNQEGMSS